jgi:general secretion pathway protein G
MSHRVLVMFCCAVLVSMPALAQEVKPQDLKMLQRLPKDPVLACAFELGNGGELFDTIIQKIRDFTPDDEEVELDAMLAGMNLELGLSLRDDLLAHIGPEVAFVVDPPPIDTTASSNVPPELRGLGLWVDVTNKNIDKSLRHLLGKAELVVTDENGLVKVAIPFGAEELPIHIYYMIDNGVLALGLDPVSVRAMTGKVDKDAQLMAGDDFSEVFSHLDRGASALFYLNLPRVQAMLNQQSQLIQPEDDPMKLLNDPRMAPCGLGISFLKMGQGTRKVSYGPAWISTTHGAIGFGAAIAIPNLLAAINRGRQKRTMNDMRNLATALETYALDTGKYPGPTDGFVEIEAIANKIELGYIQEAPRLDGWGSKILYWSDEASYRIISPGRDLEYSRDWLGLIEPHATHDFDSDIVYGDGVFLVWPEGIESQR